jgi:hypothetical protein
VILAARVTVVAEADHRVASPRLRDDVCRDRPGVVRAEEPEGPRVTEREVEERLVPLAFHQLVGLAVCRDRLAYPPHPHAGRGVPVDEVLPGGDDPRRIASDLRHVGEEDAVALAAELRAEAVDLARRDDDEGRLARRHPGPYERGGERDELPLAGVEPRLVPEPVDAHLAACALRRHDSSSQYPTRPSFRPRRAHSAS